MIVERLRSRFECGLFFAPNLVVVGGECFFSSFFFVSIDKFYFIFVKLSIQLNVIGKLLTFKYFGERRLRADFLID